MRLTYAWPRAPLLAGLALLTACSGRSTSTAAEPLPQWEIIPELSIGGADQGPTSFSDIRGLTVDDAGRIAVLDFAMQQIQMFDSTGAHLKTIGRSGQGPGEFGGANGLQRAPDGTLWVNDPLNHRIDRFDAEGGVLPEITLPFFGYGYIWDAWFEADSSLYEAIYVRVDTTTVQRYRRISLDLSRIDTLDIEACIGLRGGPPRETAFRFGAPGRQSFMGIPFVPMGMRRFDRHGHAWCGQSDAYQLTRVGISGGDTVRVTGARTPLPVTAAERDSVIGEIREFMKKIRVTEDPDFSRIPTVKPLLKTILVDDAQRLWVQPVSADSGAWYDVYGPDGRAVATVRSPLGFSPYQPVVFKGDRVWFVASDADGVPKVVRGRVKRG